MSKRALYVVADGDEKSARQEARDAVKRYRHPVEHPITNIHVPEDSRPPSLDVDEVLKRSAPDHLGKKT